jgi:hypothetical protein
VLCVLQLLALYQKARALSVFSHVFAIFCTSFLACFYILLFLHFVLWRGYLDIFYLSVNFFLSLRAKILKLIFFHITKFIYILIFKDWFFCNVLFVKMEKKNLKSVLKRISRFFYEKNRVFFQCTKSLMNTGSVRSNFMSFIQYCFICRHSEFYWMLS